MVDVSGQCAVQRFGPGDRGKAKQLFDMMSQVFEEPADALSDAYVDELLTREDFWVLAAIANGELVGGVTAHVLPLTRIEARELFVYDVAVRPDHQRRGVGRQLLGELQRRAAEAGLKELFVPADNEDQHALDFYRAVGGRGSPVTIFTFAAARGGPSSPDRIDVENRADVHIGPEPAET